MTNKFQIRTLSLANYDSIIANNQLLQYAHYYVSLPTGKLRHIVTLNFVPHALEDNVGLDETALAAYLVANNYITSAALAGYVTTGDFNAAVDLLTAAIGDAQSTADTALALAQAATSDITALEGRVGTAEGSITALLARMATAEGDIDAIEARVTTAESDIDAVETRVSAVEAQNAVFQALIAKGIQPVFGEIGSAGNLQNIIDDLDLTADTNYALVVTSTDPAVTETVSVLGTNYGLNSSSTLYLTVQGGAIVTANHDNNSVYALVSNLQTSVTALEAKSDLLLENIKAVAARQLTHVYKIAELGTTQDMRGLVSGAQNALNLLDKAYPNIHNMNTSWSTSFIFKGPGSCVIEDYFGEDVTEPTAITVRDGDMLTCFISNSQNGWFVHNAGQYYPAPAAPTDYATYLAYQPFTATHIFGGNVSLTPAQLLATRVNQIGTIFANGTQKSITINFRCDVVVTGNVTLTNEYTDSTPSDVYVLGDDSTVQFIAVWDAAAEEWICNPTTLKVSASYNTYETFNL